MWEKIKNFLGINEQDAINVSVAEAIYIKEHTKRMRRQIKNINDRIKEAAASGQDNIEVVMEIDYDAFYHSEIMMEYKEKGFTVDEEFYENSKIHKLIISWR